MIWKSITGVTIIDIGRLRFTRGGLYLKLWVNRWWTGWTWVKLTRQDIKRHLAIDAERDQ